MTLAETIRQTLSCDRPMSVKECFAAVKRKLPKAKLESVHAELSIQYRKNNIRRISKGIYQKRKFV